MGRAGSAPGRPVPTCLSPPAPRGAEQRPGPRAPLAAPAAFACHAQPPAVFIGCSSPSRGPLPFFLPPSPPSSRFPPHPTPAVGPPPQGGYRRGRPGGGRCSWGGGAAAGGSRGAASRRPPAARCRLAGAARRRSSAPLRRATPFLPLPRPCARQTRCSRVGRTGRAFAVGGWAVALPGPVLRGDRPPDRPCGSRRRLPWALSSRGCGAAGGPLTAPGGRCSATAARPPARPGTAFPGPPARGGGRRRGPPAAELPRCSSRYLRGLVCPPSFRPAAPENGGKRGFVGSHKQTPAVP